MPAARGIWVSLYDQDSPDPISHVGAGAGLVHKPIGVMVLTREVLPTGVEDGGDEDEDDVEERPDAMAPAARSAALSVEAPLTIPEAKRRLAASLRVPEASIKITIEH
jgi:hypothetical protein